MKKTLKSVFSRALVVSACALLAAPLQAEMQPSINLLGQTGLIDMPSGEQMPDGYLTLDHSRFGPILRNSLRFQLTPRLSGTFRYIGIHGWNFGGFKTYYDRNFDISYQILTEGRYRPAITIGLQDFIGTGLSSGEFIAATKNFGGKLKVTAGIGFGRLGSYGTLGQPLGPRPKINIGTGGNVNFKQWFRGDAAPFAGIEYKVNDKLTLKAEYSSDAYRTEAKRRGTFEHKSPLNFGIEYQPNQSFRFGGYYMYGSEVGMNLTIIINPDQRPTGGIGGPGPEPVLVRPSQASAPDEWATDWTELEGIKDVLLENLNKNLDKTGVVVESLGVTGTKAQVRFRNTNYDAAAQAVGRVARAMTQSLPASVELFEIVPVDHGMAGSKVVIRRTDMENLEFAPDAGHALRIRSEIVEAGDPLPGTLINPDVYPRFTWSVLPYTRTMMFSPANPLQVGVGLRFAAKYELAPGFVLAGSVTQLGFSNIANARCSDIGKSGACRKLQHVRSDAGAYYDEGNPDLETLTAAWYTRIAPNVFGRVTVGYLEQMFAGVSTEVLWRPVNRRWAVGAEANYVVQRDRDGGLGFDQYDYSVATGHVSGYYDFGNGFHGQVDVGRYLAGDVGATLSVTREFENGWVIGAFATKTNVSAKDFGEGSFDKGIKLQIPLNWLTGKPSRTSRPIVIRPIGRDGGARLDVNDRLYDVLRSYDQTRMDAQWGRVWK